MIGVGREQVMPKHTWGHANDRRAHTHTHPVDRHASDYFSLYRRLDTRGSIERTYALADVRINSSNGPLTLSLYALHIVAHMLAPERAKASRQFDPICARACVRAHVASDGR